MRGNQLSETSRVAQYLGLALLPLVQVKERSRKLCQQEICRHSIALKFRFHVVSSGHGYLVHGWIMDVHADLWTAPRLALDLLVLCLARARSLRLAGGGLQPFLTAFFVRAVAIVQPFGAHPIYTRILRHSRPPIFTSWHYQAGYIDTLAAVLL
jgi:hypothetical protein